MGFEITFNNYFKYGWRNLTLSENFEQVFIEILSILVAAFRYNSLATVS